jgi:hypothetical protein
VQSLWQVCKYRPREKPVFIALSSPRRQNLVEMGAYRQRTFMSEQAGWDIVSEVG